MRHRAIAVVFLVTILLAGPLHAQRGALVKPRTLPELTQKAERIVHAHVVSALVEPHPRYHSISTVVVTLHVDETLKGAPAQQFTFRQFIWDWRDKQDAAGYRKGREVVLFLNKVNEEGLTSPSGMDQGRLEVRPTTHGNRIVRPAGSTKLFLSGVDKALAVRGKSVPPSLQQAMKDPSSSMDLNEFKRTVRELAAERSTQ